MRILGIDPGYAIVGFGALDYVRGAFCPVQYGAITTQAHTLFEQRLEEIYFDMTQLLQNLKPDAVAMEQLYFQHNQTTAMAVAQARGVLLLCTQLARVPVFEYTPMQVKQAIVGYGKAEKQQVQQMVKLLLHMQDIARPDDAADAIAIALTHAATGPAREQFKMK